jgi:protocatechuate 3,4-dioxygenase beta subunit
MTNRRSFFVPASRVVSLLVLAGFLAACSAPQAAAPVPQTGLSAAPTAIPLASPTGAPATEVATVTATDPAAILPAASVSPQAGAAPACTSPAALTPAVTEGPFFKAGSPERVSLVEPGMQGTRVTISGRVTTSDCKPVSGALLDFWQANAQGTYDKSGYTLRGHVFTDASGFYQIETIVPGEYPGRTEHIHVKVQAPGGPLLTTQVFFPGVPDNESDSIYDPRLLMSVQQGLNGEAATYDFVIQG